MVWYYSDGNHRYGPVTEAEFATLVSQGTVRADTLVWHEGLPQWVRYRALTPESVDRPLVASDFAPRVGPRYAGFWIRYVARGLDDSFIWSAGFVVALVVWLIAGGTASLESADGWAFALGIWTGATFVTSCAYHVGFVGALGATPGKLFLKLRIVRADGSPVGFGLAFLRWLASLLNYVTLMIGWAMAAWSPQKCGLHDLICGTRVLDDGSAPGQPAGFWIRYVAKGLDGLLLAAASFVVGIPLGIVAALSGRQEVGVAVQALSYLIGAVLSCAYFTYFVGSTGATPGKSVLGLKVIQNDGMPVPYGLAAGRWFASALNYITLYVGWVMAAFTENKRGLHDLICNTRVIHTK